MEKNIDLQSLLGNGTDGSQPPEIEEKCLEYLCRLRWPNNPVCPYCDEKSRIRFDRSRRGWWCRACKSQFSIRTDTVLEGSRLKLQTWMRIIWHLTDSENQPDLLDLAERIGISQKTIHFLEYRLSKVFDGREPDETSSENSASQRPEFLVTQTEGSEKRSHTEMFEAALRQILSPGRDATYIDLRDGNPFEAFEDIDSESVHLAIIAPPVQDQIYNSYVTPPWARMLLGEDDVVESKGRVAPGLYQAMSDVSHNLASGLMHALVPGAFVVFFSQPALAHRTAMGLERAGIDVINMYVWHHTHSPPSYEPIDDTFVDRLSPFPTERKQMRRKLRNLRKPLGSPNYELLILGQKPRIGGILTNWNRYQTGLVDIDAELLECAVSGIITVEGKVRDEREVEELESKPITLMEYLIRLLSQPGQTVVDPFIGQGNTAVAAFMSERTCIGIDRDPENIDLAKQRLKAAGAQNLLGHRAEAGKSS